MKSGVHVSLSRRRSRVQIPYVPPKRMERLMIPSWIIEKLKQEERKKQEQEENDRRIQLPVPEYMPEKKPDKKKKESVTIIQL